METFDLLLRSGRVMDPARGLDVTMDVGLQNGKITAMGDLARAVGTREISLKGCIVAPGLIDIHMHMAPLAAIGIPADAACLPACVTTAADGGSAGFLTYPLLRPALQYLTVTPRIFLHVSPAGLSSMRAAQENADPGCYSLESIRRVCQKYPDEIVGLKIRIGQETVGDWGLKPLERAKEIARACGLPLMVHCTNPPAPLARVLALLEKGDIITHIYNGKGHTLMEEGAFETLRDARARGVYLDVGDAGVHTAFAVMRRALQEGLPPDSISTDSTDRGFYQERGGFHLPFAMSKWLNLGLPLEQVIACATINPARMMGLKAGEGSMTCGVSGDIAVLRLEQTPLRFWDGVGESFQGECCLRPMMTIKQGRIVWRDMALQ